MCKVPHMYLLLRGAHYDLAVPKDSITERFEAHPIKSKQEKVIEKSTLEFPCNFCDRTFDSDHGRGVHTGRKHKEEVRLKEAVQCDLCEGSYDSKESF